MLINAASDSLPGAFHPPTMSSCPLTSYTGRMKKEMKKKKKDMRCGNKAINLSTLSADLSFPKGVPCHHVTLQL